MSSRLAYRALSGGKGPGQAFGPGGSCCDLFRLCWLFSRPSAGQLVPSWLAEPDLACGLPAGRLIASQLRQASPARGSSSVGLWLELAAGAYRLGFGRDKL